MMAQILFQRKDALKILTDHTFAWTDSITDLSWLQGGPCCFKVPARNRVAQVMELVLPDRWRHVTVSVKTIQYTVPHVEGTPQDPNSHSLVEWTWVVETWSGAMTQIIRSQVSFFFGRSRRAVFSYLSSPCAEPTLGTTWSLSTFIRLVWVTAWMIRFVANCSSKIHNTPVHNPLPVQELNHATCY